MKEKLPEGVDLHNIRSREQLEETVRAAKEGCTWCNREAQKSPLICGEQFSYWEVRKNIFAKPHRDMYIIILKRHAGQMEVTAEESAEYFSVRQWLVNEHSLPGGCFIHRFGDPKLHSSGLPNVDIHYSENTVVPDGEVPVSETLVKDLTGDNLKRLEKRGEEITK